MERSNEILEDKILRILYESPTGELTSRDITEKIKDANFKQVDGVLRKRLIPNQLCIDKESTQGIVYILTTEARRRFDPPSPRLPSPRLEQPPPPPPPYQQRTDAPTATAQFKGQYTPPPFVQTQSMPFYSYQSTPAMGSFGFGVPPPPPYPYYPQPPSQQSSYPSYPQSYPTSAASPSQGKKSALKVRLTKSVDSNTQRKTEDSKNKKKQSNDSTSNQSVNDSAKIWNFLLVETRKIRNQQKTIHEMMSIPFTSGRLSTTPPPRRSFLDRKLSRSPPPSSQNPSPLDSLRTMGPPPGELHLFTTNNDEESHGKQEKGLDSEEHSE